MTDQFNAQRSIVTSWIYFAGEKMRRGDSDASIVADLRMLHGADANAAGRIVAELRAAGNTLTPLDDVYINLLRELMSRATVQSTPATQTVRMSAGLRAANPVQWQSQAEPKPVEDSEASRWKIRGAIFVGIAILGLIIEFFKGEADMSRLGIGVLAMLVMGGVMLAMGRRG